MSVSMRQLLEAGVHFGHQRRYWNPKMAPYIYGERNRIHIINLEKTLPLLQEAGAFVRHLAKNQGVMLFVGTKRQARDIIRDEATRAGCPYINHRWLGGTLTNFRTVRQSVKRLLELEAMREEGAFARMPSKEAQDCERELEKLSRNLGGIKDMAGLPDAIFVIDVGHDHGAILEAKVLGIPVVAVVDTNHDPEQVDYVVPGNDDSARAIALYAHEMADAVLAGRADALSGITPRAGVESAIEWQREEEPEDFGEI